MKLHRNNELSIVLSGDADPQSVAEINQNAAPCSAPLLIVTNFPDRFILLGASAKIVRTCREGFELSQKAEFKAIFCDMGQLGPQENGFRFAHVLKGREDTPPLFLMTEVVTAYDDLWSKRQGAQGLIRRAVDALLAVLPRQSQIASAPYMLVDSSPANQGAKSPPIAVISMKRIKVSLRRYIGPAADIMVDKTLVSIGKHYADGVPCDALIHAVSHYIEDTRQRHRFLIDMNA